MIRAYDQEDDGHKGVDFMDPWFQDTPESRAILGLLRRLTERFQDLPAETTDIDWTAFRALAKAGAAEGIIRNTCTYADADEPCTEYFHVRGDYPSVAPSKPILTTEPYECTLVRARLTTTGIRWAEYLAREDTQPPEKVRAAVLHLLWDAQAQPGSVQRVPPPVKSDAMSAPAAVSDSCDREKDSQSKLSSDDHGRGDESIDTGEMEFGLPEEDLYERRAVNWLGKRLYLGYDTQISRVFWLLVKHLGRPQDLGAMQRAVDGFETSRKEDGEEAFKKAMQRLRKAISKLRNRLQEHDLDDHVIILKEGPNDWPSYTMICRFDKP